MADELGLINLFTDPRAVQKIADTFATAFARGGHSSSFSSINPTGEGKAGGRGRASDEDLRKEITNTIKTRQLESKFLNQVTKNLSVLNQELDKAQDDFRGAAQYTERFSKLFGDVWNKAMSEVAKSKKSETRMIELLDAALEEDIKTMDDVLAIRQRQQHLEKQISDETIATSKHMIDEHKRFSQALGEATHNLEDGGKSFLNQVQRGIRAFFSLEVAFINLIRSVNRLVDDFKLQLKTGSQMNTFMSQWAAIISGVDPRAFVEMMASSRQASLTFDSMNDYVDLVSQQHLKYFNQIGDLTEASKFTTDMFMILGRSGIRPNVKDMDTLGDSFRLMNKIAGQTSEQFVAMMEQVSGDVDMQTRLRVARKEDRAAIIAGTAAQIALNRSMGLSEEQAIAAAIAMGKIAGGGAKERFKRAAQMQMAFSALGIQGGAEMAELERKGKARMTPEEAKRFEVLGTRLTKAATAAKGGSIPLEMMRDTILEKTGLDQYFGEDSPLNKQLGEGLKTNAGLLVEIRDAIRSDMTIAEKGLAIFQGIGNFIASGLGGLLTTIVQFAGATWMLGLIGKLGVLGGLGAAVGTLATAAVMLVTAAATFAAVYKGTEYLMNVETPWTDSLATNIIDGLSRLPFMDALGDEYDPNIGVQEAIQQRKEARALQEKQLAAAEHTNEMEERRLGIQESANSDQKAQTRLARLAQTGQNASTVT